MAPVVILALAAAGCSGRHHEAASPRKTVTQALAPPVVQVRRPDPSLSCPARPRTTVDLLGCAERKLAASGTVLNVQIRHVYGLTGNTVYRDRRSVERRALIRSERAWAARRDQLCVSETGAYVNASSPHSYVGGTLAPVSYGLCVVTLNAAHRRELARTASLMCELRQGLVAAYRRGCG